jgi:DNA-binding response OmpR family regulator
VPEFFTSTENGRRLEYSSRLFSDNVLTTAWTLLYQNSAVPDAAGGLPSASCVLRIAQEGLMRVLLVEDDEAVASLVRRGLVQEGFSVDAATDGRDAFHRALDESYDVIILDLVIPYVDGLELLGRLRKEGSGVPVLILSAKDTVEDRVRGLNCGADDYLVKPFSFAELSARVRALLRRHSAMQHSSVRVGDLIMDFASRKVMRDGHTVTLTPKEFALLEYLVRNQGTVLTRTMIAEHVWDQHFDSFSNTIDVYIRYLRAKLEEGSQGRLIHTIRGVGYVFSAEVQ